ncbi:MAG: nucleoside hydrolase [Planctomycetota bacterium]
MTTPAAPVRMILDTDTYNEVDDQFALAWAALDTERFTLEAVTAAPFSNERADTPRRGMELSFDEIGRVLELAGRTDIPAHRGATDYLPDASTPVASDAVDQIIERSKTGHVWVVAIGAITNVASALLTDPTLRERISVAWLGGHSRLYTGHAEFNLRQDVAAAKVVYDSGVPLAWFPCAGSASHLLTTELELRTEVGGVNPLCDFLIDRFVEHATDWTQRHGTPSPWHSKIIWDLAPLAWLGGLGQIATVELPRPTWHATDPPTHTVDPDAPPCLECLHINRDVVFRAVFDVLTRAGGGGEESRRK